MKHYTEDEWTEWIREQAPDSLSVDMESHLYECEECLSIYMHALELHTSALPVPKDIDELEYDQLFKRTTRLSVKEESSWRETAKHTYFQYAVAAAATLILTISGFFSGLSQELGDWKEPTDLQQSTSISENLMNQTLSWLDTLQSKSSEGGNP